MVGSFTAKAMSRFFVDKALFALQPTFNDRSQFCKTSLCSPKNIFSIDYNDKRDICEMVDRTPPATINVSFTLLLLNFQSTEVLHL